MLETQLKEVEAKIQAACDLSLIHISGVFDKITPSPKCWIYPSAHGSLNVVGALQHSCNDFFYEVGYRLGQDSNGNYDSDTGLEKLARCV